MSIDQNLKRIYGLAGWSLGRLHHLRAVETELLPPVAPLIHVEHEVTPAQLPVVRPVEIGARQRHLDERFQNPTSDSKQNKCRVMGNQIIPMPMRLI